MPFSGYENENGVSAKQHFWRTFTYLDRTEWVADLLKLNQQALDPKREHYSKNVFLAFEAGGRVDALINIQLVGKPLREKKTKTKQEHDSEVTP